MGKGWGGGRGKRCLPTSSACRGAASTHLRLLAERYKPVGQGVQRSGPRSEVSTSWFAELVLS